MKRALPLLLAASVLVSAQATRRRAPRPSAPKAPAAESARTGAWPLTSLRVTGAKLYSEAAILAAAGLQVGQPVTREDFEKARDRLIVSGAFETVGFEFAPAPGGNGYQGRFDVIEIQQVYPYRLEELPGTDAELRAFLKQREPLFGNRIPGTQEVVSRFTRHLNEYAAARQFADQVVGRVVSTAPGELEVLFRPSTPPPVVASVQFTGNQALSTAVLNNALGEVAIGVAYTEKHLRDLLETSIRPLYEANGRMLVKFPQVEARPAGGDVKGLKVSVVVDEGPEFKFGEVKIQSSALRPADLAKAAAINPDSRADFDKVKAAREAIRKVFHKAGYMDAEITSDRRINAEAKTVDVTLRAIAGPRYSMGRLEIKGLDVISEPAIRKLWALQTGAPYDATYAAMFLDRVKEEYLENLKSASFEQKTDPEKRTVDVTLIFAGGAEPPKPEEKRP